ncbi:RNA polymerase sigma factor, FliA/WhiG family protein [Collimonas fungivorans]|uniref:RNA polymerase sigma factor FliA n=1 Tax=Collimonas fungivorans TaxID=158899 RepID=A0A127P8F5_9BURK|nr:RNA polymerase sigma factor FliA [Collimonas fungivorans]AMO93924.1 RNA polymerase sigma factor, FliA/WhiG family protein [Collimonas fungivorans]
MYTAQGKIDKSDTLAQYAPLVRRLALQLIAKLPASVELDDMIQAGMLGLLDAANRYQDDQGAQFETYASQRIRGAMLDELRANDWLSRGLRQSSRKVDAAVQALEQKLARPPSEREIALSMQLSLEDYQHLLQEIHGSQLVYYEDCEGGSNENSFLDRQHDDSNRSGAGDPLQRLLDSGMRHMLVEAIALMPERERLLLSLYYEQEMNLREIGAVLEVSQSRVCQLHSQAISRLRVRLNETSRSEIA